MKQLKKVFNSKTADLVGISISALAFYKTSYELALKAMMNDNTNVLKGLGILSFTCFAIYIGLERLKMKRDKDYNLIDKKDEENLANTLPLEDWPVQDKLDLNQQTPENLNTRPYNQDEIVPNY